MVARVKEENRQMGRSTSGRTSRCVGLAPHVSDPVSRESGFSYDTSFERVGYCQGRRDLFQNCLFAKKMPDKLRKKIEENGEKRKRIKKIRRKSYFKFEHCLKIEHDFVSFYSASFFSSCIENFNSSPLAVAVIARPSFNSPETSIRETGVSRSRCTARLRGRAPYTGS